MVRGGRQHSARAFAEDNAALVFGVCPRWAAHRRADPLFNLQPSWPERQSCMSRRAEFALFLIASCARSVWATDRFYIKMARTRAGASIKQQATHPAANTPSCRRLALPCSSVRLRLQHQRVVAAAVQRCGHTRLRQHGALIWASRWTMPQTWRSKLKSDLQLTLGSHRVRLKAGSTRPE